MKRENFDKAFILIDKANAIKGIKEKIKREIAELGYGKGTVKEIGDDIFNLLDTKLKSLQKEFDEL